jgi:hypothetical protein
VNDAQLPELVRLRWRMVRSERVRLGLLLLAALLPGLWCAAVIGGQLAPSDDAFDPTLLARTAFLGFAVLSLVAPLAAGGGNELFPPDQLVAYPVRPSTDFAASLLVAPLNLAWMSQFLVLFAITSFATANPPHGVDPTGSYGLGLALVTTLLYIAVVTIAGQALAWAIIGVRQSAAGRRAVWVTAAVIGLAVIALVRAHFSRAVVDAAPTTRVFDTVSAGASEHVGHWLSGTATLAGLLFVCLWAGPRLCAWALRRPGDAGRFKESAPRRRRLEPATALGSLIRVDRASVWRASPLRRGLLVLTVLPGAVAAGAGLEWSSLTVLPALVTAGAGLLFGVNMFCLDAGGATWLASLPHPPRLAIVSKTIVLAETIVGSALVAAVAGSLRTVDTPSVADAAALLGCIASCAAVVLATCVHISLRRPGRAELRGSRDTPAPPAAMAVYSVRLATMTTLIGLTFGEAARLGSWQVPAVFTAALVVLSGLSVLRNMREWDTPQARSTVVAAVSNG